jgi:hypothetical protein
MENLSMIAQLIVAFVSLLLSCFDNIVKEFKHYGLSLTRNDGWRQLK